MDLTFAEKAIILVVLVASIITVAVVLGRMDNAIGNESEDQRTAANDKIRKGGSR